MNRARWLLVPTASAKHWSALWHLFCLSSTVYVSLSFTFFSLYHYLPFWFRGPFCLFHDTITLSPSHRHTHTQALLLFLSLCVSPYHSPYLVTYTLRAQGEHEVVQKWIERERNGLVRLG